MARRARPSGTSLDAKKRALAEQEEKLRQHMDKLQRLIEEAPIRAEESKKKRREELVSRNPKGARRLDSPTLVDRRFELQLPTRTRRRARKGERRVARLKFFVLCLVLLGFLLWLYTLMS
jgi:hypothetical protein